MMIIQTMFTQGNLFNTGSAVIDKGPVVNDMNLIESDIEW